MVSRCLVVASVLFSIPLAAVAQEVRGIIRKVDPQQRELIVEVRVRGLRRVPMRFEVSRQAQVRIGQEASELSALRPGDRAVVTYEDRDDRHVATAISTWGLRAAAAPGASRDEETIVGTLARVAPRDRELTVMSPDPEGEGHNEVRLVVAQTARISRDQRPIALEDLREGDRVTVRAEKRDDRFLAFDVQAGKVKPPLEAADTRIERLRRLLKAADQALDRLSEKRTLPPPPSEGPPVPDRPPPP